MSKRFFFAAIIATLGAVSATASLARESGTDVWSRFDGVTLPSPRSRAEVLAELEIYRRSGLAELERGEHTNPFSHAHRVASARYAAMRSSTEFTSLVQAIAQHRGESVGFAQASGR
jgi:hypothetical protein